MADPNAPIRLVDRFFEALLTYQTANDIHDMKSPATLAFVAAWRACEAAHEAEWQRSLHMTVVPCHECGHRVYHRAGFGCMVYPCECRLETRDDAEFENTPPVPPRGAP